MRVFFFFEEVPPSRCDLLKNLERRDLFLQRVGNMWREEYLLVLRELVRYLYQSDFNNVTGVDDVELIKNPAKSCPYWSLGRVIRVTPWNNTYIRSALVKKSDSTNQVNSLKHLFPLKLSITHSNRTSETLEELSDSENISGIPANVVVVGASGSMLSSKRVNDRNEDYLWY